MFWSKIWFFFVAVAGAVALTIALVLPRPAARAKVSEERSQLRVACGAIGILLTDDARKRVDLAGAFSRFDKIVKEVEDASAAGRLDEARMKTARATAETVMKGIKGDRQPDFAMLIDKRGRVIARVKLDEKVYGDIVAGRPLIDDALAGYLRDDLWAVSGTLYFVSASPVVKGTEFLGAVVLGHQVTNDLAKKLVSLFDVSVSFYIGDSTAASSRTIALDQGALQAGFAKLTGPDITQDCREHEPFPMRASGEDLTAIVARLPGEAGARKAFYTVFINRPAERGFLATLKDVRRDDLSFENFPWIFVAGGVLIVLAAGFVLMLLEADRPLRRLAAEAVRLAKGDIEKLAEDAHPGKFGSIARSVNIHIDKLARDAKAAKKDLDQLLGPAPEGSLGTIDLLATALPSIRPGGAAPAAKPPPSEFKFHDSSSPSPSASQQRPAIPRPGTPPPVAAPSGTPSARHNTPPSMPGVAPPMPGVAPAPSQSQPQMLATPRAPSAPPLPPAQTPPPELVQSPGASSPRLAPQAPPLEEETAEAEELLDEPAFDEPSPDRTDPYFKQVFDQFIAVKKSCNEPISGLTFDKFVEKLIRNRDELRSKTGCREVRFTVYVKDGKAALKATPVKEE